MMPAVILHFPTGNTMTVSLMTSAPDSTGDSVQLFTSLRDGYAVVSLVHQGGVPSRLLFDLWLRHTVSGHSFGLQ